MALSKRVVGEFHNGVEQFLAEIFPVPRLRAAGNEAVTRLFHFLRNLLSACFAQVVGLGHGKPSELLRHAHQTFLVNHETKSVPQHICCVRVEILNLFALVFIVSKIVVHVGAHWPRAVERKYSRQIFKALGDQRLQQCTHL